MKKSLVLAGIMALTVGVNIASAKCNCTLPPQGRPPMGREMQGPPPPQMTEEQKAEFKKRMEAKKAEMDKCLKLTEEQKAKIDAIHKKTQETMKPIRTKIRAKYEEIKAVEASKLAPAAQKEKIDKLKCEIDALRKEAMEIHKADRAAFDAVLTDKQKKKLEKMRKDKKGEFEKRGNKCKCKNGPMPMPGFGPPPPPPEFE